MIKQVCNRIFRRKPCNEAGQFFTTGRRFSLGEYTNLCSPNEVFRRLNKRPGVSFRVTLRVFVDQIECSHPRKVPRKDTPDFFFVEKLRLGQPYATPPLFRQSPFQRLRQNVNLQSRLNRMTKSLKWRLSKKGRSGIRLVRTRFGRQAIAKFIEKDTPDRLFSRQTSSFGEHILG